MRNDAQIRQQSSFVFTPFDQDPYIIFFYFGNAWVNARSKSLILWSAHNRLKNLIISTFSCGWLDIQTAGLYTSYHNSTVIKKGVRGLE
jgi:hypothetical protein